MYNPLNNYIFTFVLTLNLLMAKVLILYPLKISKNQTFSGVFRRYEMGILARDELNIIPKL